MKQTISAVMAVLLIGLASIVPWASAQQKPAPVAIWCQNTSGGFDPCQAGNSLDYDSGAGTVNQGTVGIVLPASGGPVAGGTLTSPLRVDPTGTTTQPVSDTGVGATSDAAATAGSTGSLSAKLRLITTQLDNLLTELGQKTEPANTQTVSGTVTANVGTTNGLHLDSTFTGRFPAAFASADNIAAQTATAMHGLLYGWDSGGSNWDRLLTTSGALHVNVQNSTLAATQSGTWTMQPGNTANTTAWLFKLDQTSTNNDIDVVSLPAIPAGNNNIGDVDVASLPALPAGSNTIGNVNQAGTWTVQPGNTANTTAWLFRFADPCSSAAKTFIPISITGATTTELTASLAGASTNYYVCSLNLVTAAANNVALVDDDTDNCASVTSGLAGGTTAASGWNFAANGGLTFGNGQSSIFKTNGANRVLCLVTSAATQLSGSMTVVAAP